MTVTVASDFFTAGYWLVINGRDIRPLNGTGSWSTPDEALEWLADQRCNCTEDGGTYCAEPDCDIDFCGQCGEEYDQPCGRHEEAWPDR